MHGRDGRWRTVCDLTIERNGNYAFSFSYDPPYRLSGQPLDRRFDDYLQRYLAGKAG